MKKKGLVDDSDADPIPFELYKDLLKWSLESNNTMVWFWTISQWNFMGRSSSIAPMAMYNFRVGTDSLIVKYDLSKDDQYDEVLSEKNIYSNP